LAPAITGVALRRSSNGVLSGGLYRGPRTSSLRNKAVCKDAVCSFVNRRARSHQLNNAMPSSTGPPQPIPLDSSGKSLQTEWILCSRSNLSEADVNQACQTVVCGHSNTDLGVSTSQRGLTGLAMEYVPASNPAALRLHGADTVVLEADALASRPSSDTGGSVPLEQGLFAR